MDEDPQPMDEDRFWAVVWESGGDADRLRQILLRRSRDDILGFDLRLYEALQALNRRDIHDVTDGSDDGFLYRRLWIVSRGRAYFESVLRDPDNAPHFAHDEENEEFMYAAYDAYEEKFGEPWPDHPHHAGMADAPSWL